MSRSTTIAVASLAVLAACLFVPYALAGAGGERAAPGEPAIDRTDRAGPAVDPPPEAAPHADDPPAPEPVVHHPDDARRADRPVEDRDEEAPPSPRGRERPAGRRPQQPRPGEGPRRNVPGREGPLRPLARRPWVRRPPMQDAELQRMQRQIELIERMRHSSFDPATAALMALGSLQRDVHREHPEDLIAELEDLLKQTKTLGLRNSIRLTLRDLYRHTDNFAKMSEHLKAMILENDAAMMAAERAKKNPS